jgi:hypothetical protein
MPVPVLEYDELRSHVGHILECVSDPSVDHGTAAAVLHCVDCAVVLHEARPEPVPPPPETFRQARPAPGSVRRCGECRRRLGPNDGYAVDDLPRSLHYGCAGESAVVCFECAFTCGLFTLTCDVCQRRVPSHHASDPGAACAVRRTVGGRTEYCNGYLRLHLRHGTRVRVPDPPAPVSVARHVLPPGMIVGVDPARPDPDPEFDRPF